MGTIAITGASSGLGRATALHFAERGWRVAATMRTPDQHAELADRQEVRLYRLDVTDGASIERARDAILSDMGTVDVVVNNAGYPLAGPFEPVTEAQIRRQFDTNVFGAMAVTKAFLPHFRAQRSGTFVNVTSLAGRVPVPFLSLYVSSKFALEGFSEAVAYELREFGIRVKLVEPGNYETDANGRSLDRPPRDAIPEYLPAWSRFGRAWQALEHGPAEQVAEAVFEAVTDGEDRLRYLVGADAEWWVRYRHEHDEDAFSAKVAETFLP